jgi:CDP-4-dehydro-6-deoxyglucose reductase, E3
MNYQNFPKPQKVALKVISIDKVSAKDFFVLLEMKEEVSFLPGQFITINISPTERRSYSVVYGKNPKQIGLYVDITPNGAGSEFFIAMNKGLTVDGTFPLGRFVYVKESLSRVFFIGTGTGIAPLKTMIDYELQGNKSGREIILLWGVRYFDDLFLHDYFNQLQEKFTNLKYIPTISREEKEGILNGRVSQAIHNIDLLKEDEFYLCGSRDMIDSMREILISKGATADNIFFEQFY